RIRDHQCAGWDGGRLLAVKSQRLVASGLDFAGSIRQCDMRGHNRKRSGAKCIGETDADSLAADGNMNNLPQGGVGKSGCWRRTAFIYELWRRCPCSHPMGVTGNPVVLFAP